MARIGSVGSIPVLLMSIHVILAFKRGNMVQILRRIGATRIGRGSIPTSVITIVHAAMTAIRAEKTEPSLLGGVYVGVSTQICWVKGNSFVE